MHYVSTLDEAAFSVPPDSKKHSQGYSRIALVDHSVGSVHMGVGVAQLEAGGRLASHLHSFEEGFFILEGQVLGSVDGLAHARQRKTRPTGCLHCSKQKAQPRNLHLHRIAKTR